MTEEEQTRKPGRPKSLSVKKGRPSWKPASVTDVTDKDPGFRYRWVNKNPDNLAKKQAEGWEIKGGITADKAQAVSDHKMDSGNNLTSVYEKRDVVLARIPEEIALERDAYMEQKTQKRTLGLTAHLKKGIKEAAGNAPLHGNITISSLRGGDQVIE